MNNGIGLYSVNEMLMDRYQYIIPIYQRNYAWEEKEIYQLIDDIELARKYNRNKNYYIGTLVVDKKKKYYEVIDGQQRLTTLNLLYRALTDKSEAIKLNLAFDHQSREQYNETLKFIAKEHTIEKIRNSLEYGFDIIRKYIVQDGVIENKEDFIEFLLNQVSIFRTEIPADTDRAHYFEIMNTRGEQLENHEIIKANLMAKLSEKNRESFSMIWNACSEMGYYVITRFDNNLQRYLKNNEIEERSKYPNLFNKEHKVKTYSIRSALSSKSLPEEPIEKSNRIEKFPYESVVDFQHFLMIALKIYENNKNTAEVVEDDNNKIAFLRDVHIIKRFKEAFNEETTSGEIIKFSLFLLKLRLLFDGYIIKKSNDNDDGTDGIWDIRKYKETKENKTYFTKQFSDERVLQLVSMFHFSFTQRQKPWLYDVLNILYQERSISYSKQSKSVANSYFNKLKILANKYYINRTYDGYLRAGTKTSRYILNYLDYLIWEKYNEGVKKDKKNSNEKLKFIQDTFFGKDKNDPLDFYQGDYRDKIVGYFDDFYFNFKNSVEHCFPQSKKDKLKKGLIDDFGNLCLTTSEFNSSLSDREIRKKREMVLDSDSRKSSKSLKQILLLMYGESWDNPEKVITSHHNKMVEIFAEESKKVEELKR